MTKIREEHLEQAEIIFRDMNHHVSIEGVLRGELLGTLELSEDGATAMLTSPQGIFFGGNAGNVLFLQKMNAKLRDVVLPRRYAERELDYVVFYPNREEWENGIEIALLDLYSMKSGRLTLTHDLERVEETPADGSVIVDESLLRQDWDGVDGIIHEILKGWPSIEAFLHRGFGCAALTETDRGVAIIGWCLTDWVVGDVCEFGIETDAAYRMQGWGRKMAAGALSLAKRRGIRRVGWQCWHSNEGSWHTALSAGFTRMNEHTVRFGWTHPLSNFLINGNYYMRGDVRYGVMPDYARSAWSYAQALDQGWDWNGYPAVYWNAACMHYLTGELERAKYYYGIAVAKGWKGLQSLTDRRYVYNGEDSTAIENELSVS